MPLKTVNVPGPGGIILLAWGQRSKITLINVGANDTWISHSGAIIAAAAEGPFYRLRATVAGFNGPPLIIDDELEASMAWYAYDAVAGTTISIYYAAASIDKPRPIRVTGQPIETDPLGGLKKLIGV